MSDTQTEQVPVYAAACADYFRAGWPCVIPVPPEAKFPPPSGFTGAGGKDTAPEDIAEWAERLPGYSIALRMPDGVIGLDVDEYVKGGQAKHGAATLAAREEQWGPLPPTPSSTARGQGQPSRILFFRAPAQRYASVLGPDVEVIQRHHRYAVVAPSPHYSIGSLYQWYAPDGSPMNGKLPRPEDLAELPAAWVAGLAEGAAAAGPAAASRGDSAGLLAYLQGEQGQVCTDMVHAAAAIQDEIRAAAPGSRHDLMTKAVYELVQLAAEGHTGYGLVTGTLRDLWSDLTAGEDRDAEFADMITTAARKAVTAHGMTPSGADPCGVGVGVPRFEAPRPAGAAGDDELPPPVEPPRFWSLFNIIGIEPFTPAGGLDAILARDVLARVHPVLRYAPDAGAWLVRGPDRWAVLKGDLAKWGIDTVSWLMPDGDSEAEAGSPEKLLAEKRKRFTMNSSANGIAGKMHAQVMAGHHPSTVNLASLDGEREILWAGGMPYDLRDSADGPAVAQWTDPGTPHLHSAGVVPELRPTPLWDAFLETVWPDPDLRDWAVRVLSVSFTGYADKALPILLGDTDRGKTQVIVLLMSVLGDYAHVADARLLAPADRSHASIVYALFGRRMSFIDEAPRTGQQATERLKQISGGADLTGNRMGENPVTFSPTHTLILTANPEHEPVLTDAAIRRRVRLIPCDGDPATVRAARAVIGAENGPAWRAEAPGVLAKMMVQAARWMADPYSASNEAAPLAAAQAAREIMISQDLPLQWLAEECEDWERGTRSRELYLAFTESCRRMSVNPASVPSETKWGRRLTELGYPPVKRMDANYRTLRIRPPQLFVPGFGDLSGQSGGSARPATENHGGSRSRMEGLLEGSGSSAKPSIREETPGQTIHETIHNGGYGGSDTSLYTHTRTHTHMQGGKGSTLHTLQPSMPASPADGAAADPEEEEVSSPGVTEAEAERQLALIPEGPPVPAAKARKGRLTEEEKLAREAARAEAKAARDREKAEAKIAEQAARLRDAEGAIVTLPAVVARVAGRVPAVVPVSLDEARLLAGGYPDGLCVDVEHTGYSPGRAEYALRLVQLGGEHAAVVFDPDDEAQREVIRGVLAEARVLHAHSAIADLIPLALAGLADAGSLWDRMVDSVLIAKLADPALAGSDESQLKKLSTDLLGAYAVSEPAEKAKNELFRTGGWLIDTKAQTPVERVGWAQVRKNCEVFVRYAGCDVLDLAAVIRVLPRPEGTL